jgi:hypothetical protein
MSQTISSKAGNVRFGIILGILLAVAVIFFQKEWNIAMYIASGLALALISLKVFFTLKTLRQKREHEAYLVRRAEQDKIDLQNQQKRQQEEKNHHAAMLEKIPEVVNTLKTTPLKTWNEIYYFIKTTKQYYPYTQIAYKHESEEYRTFANTLSELVNKSMFDAKFTDSITISDTKKQIVFNQDVIEFIRIWLRDLIKCNHNDEVLQQLYRQYKELQEALKGKSEYQGYKKFYELLTYPQNGDIVEILGYNDIVFEEPTKK